MNDAKSIGQSELRRWVVPISIGIAVLWLVPVSLVAVVASHEKHTWLGATWSYSWLILYALSLLAWRLPSGWFYPREWEVRGRIYEALGVRWYKQFMLGGDRHNRRVRRRLENYRIYADSRTTRRLANETRVSERVHIIMLLFATWPALFGALAGWWKYAAFVTAGNVLVNVYPIVLQRYTRSRIMRIERRRVAS